MPMEAAVPSAFSVTPCVNWELTGITSNQFPTNSLSSFCVAVWHEANKPAATASIIDFFMVYTFISDYKQTSGILSSEHNKSR